MTDQDGFGAYLRRLRESKGLSLRQAAKDAGVSSGYLSQIEGEKRGKRKTGEHFAPHPQILKELAAVYHVPAQDLFERAGFFEKQKDFFGFSEERETDRCFDFVLHDPVFRKVLTTRDKKAIIDRYETLSGRKFITWGGENSLLNEKSEYKGLHLLGGSLYAETIQTTLTLEEVAQELDISLDSVKTLIEHGHIYTIGSTKGQPVIEKAEIRQLKAFAIGEGLKLLLLRYRKDRPQAPEDYEKAQEEMGAKGFEKLKEKVKKHSALQKTEQDKPSKKKSSGAK